MARITDFRAAARARARAAAEQERAAAEQELAAALERISALGQAHPALARRTRRILAGAKPARGGFMRVWIDREQEITDDLEARAREQREARGEPLIAVNTTLRVLAAARATLPPDGQRMDRTQAQLAAQLNIRANLISLAFQELRAVGAVLGRERKGQSITWEIDAEYASRLGDDARNKAITAQQQLRQQEAMSATKQAALDRIGHRILPWPGVEQGGTITDDPRQIDAFSEDDA